MYERKFTGNFTSNFEHSFFCRVLYIDLKITSKFFKVTSKITSKFQKLLVIFIFVKKVFDQFHFKITSKFASNFATLFFTKIFFSIFIQLLVTLLVTSLVKLLVIYPPPHQFAHFLWYIHKGFCSGTTPTDLQGLIAHCFLHLKRFTNPVV